VRQWHRAFLYISAPKGTGAYQTVHCLISHAKMSALGRARPEFYMCDYYYIALQQSALKV